MFIITYTRSKTKDILEEIVDIAGTTRNIYTVTKMYLSIHGKRLLI